MKILFVLTSCKKSGPINQMLSIAKNLSFNNELYLLTTRKEQKDSELDKFLPFVTHKFVEVNRFSAIFCPHKKIKKIIDSLNPDIIHTLGVLPDYFIEKMHYENHIFTCRNYVFDDYISEYGLLLGFLLAILHIKAIRKCKNVYCCSKALSDIYFKKMHLNLPYINNGVNVSEFLCSSTSQEKSDIRAKLNLPLDKKICVYAAKFDKRKNQQFLLKYIGKSKSIGKIHLVLLGTGKKYSKLKNKYSDLPYVYMPGDVSNVSLFLKAADFYISASRSEGMPNGVLEALSSGLPVLLSNIPQHIEVANHIKKYCFIFNKTKEDFCNKLDFLLKQISFFSPQDVRNSCENNFSSSLMANHYFEAYQKIIGYR